MYKMLYFVLSITFVIIGWLLIVADVVPWCEWFSVDATYKTFFALYANAMLACVLNERFRSVSRAISRTLLVVLALVAIVFVWFAIELTRHAITPFH